MSFLRVLLCIKWYIAKKVEICKYYCFDVLHYLLLLLRSSVISQESVRFCRFILVNRLFLCLNQFSVGQFKPAKKLAFFSPRTTYLAPPSAFPITGSNRVFFLKLPTSASTIVLWLSHGSWRLESVLVATDSRHVGLVKDVPYTKFGCICFPQRVASVWVSWARSAVRVALTWERRLIFGYNNCEGTHLMTATPLLYKFENVCAFLSRAAQARRCFRSRNNCTTSANSWTRKKVLRKVLEMLWQKS